MPNNYETFILFKALFYRKKNNSNRLNLPAAPGEVEGISRATIVTKNPVWIPGTN